MRSGFSFFIYSSTSASQENEIVDFRCSQFVFYFLMFTCTLSLGVQYRLSILKAFFGSSFHYGLMFVCVLGWVGHAALHVTIHSTQVRSPGGWAIGLSTFSGRSYTHLSYKKKPPEWYAPLELERGGSCLMAPRWLHIPSWKIRCVNPTHRKLRPPSLRKAHRMILFGL